MSNNDDYGLAARNREPTEGTSELDRNREITSRFELSQEAARAEMDRFRGIAEYEIRKIFGQRSVLKQPVDMGPPKKTKRKKAAPTEPHSGLLNPREPGQNREEVADSPDQAATTATYSDQTELDFDH